MNGMYVSSSVSAIVSSMLLGAWTLLSDIVTASTRPRITNSERLKLARALLELKFQRRENSLSFIGYRISCGSRANAVGIIREVFVRNDYDARLPDSPTIFDVGANIGISTLYFSRYFPGASITSFEAMPENFRYLEANVSNNNLPRVTPVLGFLGRKTGTVDVFYNSKNPGGSTGVERIVESKTRANFSKVGVTALRLSDYIHGEVDLMKMDVEGAEAEILRDLDETETMTRIKQMVFEYHYNLENTSNDLADVLHILKKNGFSIVIYDNEGGSYGKAMRPIPFYHFMIRAFRADQLPR